MLAGLLKQLVTAFILLLFFSIVCGLLYPGVITLFAQTLFSEKANGSLIIRDNTVIGSALIGQSFTAPKYFWGRPSATMPYPYNAQASAGSNFGPLSPDYLAVVKERQKQFDNSAAPNHSAVPVELVTASASGLDPDISPLAAFFQIQRIAKVRGIPEDDIEKLIRHAIKKRCFGILGEPRVNVLLLNLQLDEMETSKLKDRKL
jgi:K+-transporting ATPase ATPase C chain